MSKVGTEPMPLRIIKFHKYLQKCTINIPTNVESLWFLGTVPSDADKKIVNNNQTWVVPIDPGTSPFLQTGSDEGASARTALEKYTKYTTIQIQHQHGVRQHAKKKWCTRNTKLFTIQMQPLNYHGWKKRLYLTWWISTPVLTQLQPTYWKYVNHWKHLKLNYGYIDHSTSWNS